MNIGKAAKRKEEEGEEDKVQVTIVHKNRPKNPSPLYLKNAKPELRVMKVVLNVEWPDRRSETMQYVPAEGELSTFSISSCERAMEKKLKKFWTGQSECDEDDDEALSDAQGHVSLPGARCQGVLEIKSSGGDVTNQCNSVKQVSEESDAVLISGSQTQKENQKSVPHLKKHHPAHKLTPLNGLQKAGIKREDAIQHGYGLRSHNSNGSNKKSGERKRCCSSSSISSEEGVKRKRVSLRRPHVQEQNCDIVGKPQCEEGETLSPNPIGRVFPPSIPVATAAAVSKVPLVTQAFKIPLKKVSSLPWVKPAQEKEDPKSLSNKTQHPKRERSKCDLKNREEQGENSKSSPLLTELSEPVPSSQGRNGFLGQKRVEIDGKCDRKELLQCGPLHTYGHGSEATSYKVDASKEETDETDSDSGRLFILSDPEGTPLRSKSEPEPSTDGTDSVTDSSSSDSCDSCSETSCSRSISLSSKDQSLPPQTGKAAQQLPQTADCEVGDDEIVLDEEEDLEFWRESPPTISTQCDEGPESPSHLTCSTAPSVGDSQHMEVSSDPHEEVQSLSTYSTCEPSAWSSVSSTSTRASSPLEVAKEPPKKQGSEEASMLYRGPWTVKALKRCYADQCWKQAFSGDCSYGAKCKFRHDRLVTPSLMVDFQEFLVGKYKDAQAHFEMVLRKMHLDRADVSITCNMVKAFLSVEQVVDAAMSVLGVLPKVRPHGHPVLACLLERLKDQECRLEPMQLFKVMENVKGCQFIRSEHEMSLVLDVLLQSECVDGLLDAIEHVTKERGLMVPEGVLKQTTHLVLRLRKEGALEKRLEKLARLLAVYRGHNWYPFRVFPLPPSLDPRHTFPQR